MIQLHQPNLEQVTDAESVYEAFLYLARQLPEKASELFDDLNLRISWDKLLSEQVQWIQDFTNAFIDAIFQPLVERIADISPSRTDQRDHPLREFNHELTTLPLNLSQRIIDLVASNKIITTDLIRPLLSYVLIRNSHNQVFLALSSTEAPIWKQ